jgi:hypothetical protein
MEPIDFLIEYLKDQYVHARHHETLQSNTTAFLTAAAGVILGLGFKDGVLKPEGGWLGFVIMFIGAANLWINSAHQLGNRYRTALAGYPPRGRGFRRKWPEGMKNASCLRNKALKDFKLKKSGAFIGKKTYRRLQLVPAGVMAIGVLLVVLAWKPELVAPGYFGNLIRSWMVLVPRPSYASPTVSNPDLASVASMAGLSVRVVAKTPAPSDDSSAAATSR